jgi:hypothetical protein
MLFNPYVDKPEWPACVVVEAHDQNDVRPNNRMFVKRTADVFRAGDDADVESELHAAYVNGFVQCRRIA